MTPWETSYDAAIAVNGDTVVVPCPGRCVIDRVAVQRRGNGAITADFYNRAFTGPSAVVRQITTNGNGKCRLVFAAAYAVSVGDVLTVSGSDQGGYNTSHRVTARANDDKTIDTDVVFTAQGGKCAAVLAVPSAEQPLYKAFAQLTGTDFAESFPAVVFVNQDPQLKGGGRGFPGKLYVKFAAAGTYRVSLRARESVAMGD